MHSSTGGDDLVANSFKDPDFHADISTGAGDDYIWTNIFVPVMQIDGGSGFDIFKIPDGWLGNFVVTPTDDGWIINHGQGNNLFYVTGVELLILATASGTVEYFRDPYFDKDGGYVDFNNLTDVQKGLFNGIGKWYVTNWQYSSWEKFWVSQGSEHGDDTVYLPNAANYVIHDNGYNPADVIWDYDRVFMAWSGIDTVHGGDYHDKIDGGLGKDLLYGGAGNDTFWDTPFSNDDRGFGGYIDGGAGNDTFHFSTSPTRIVTAADKVIWSQGGPTSLTTTGEKLYAEWLDAAGGLVGWIEINNVENLTNLVSGVPATERLFNDYANLVNFTALGAHEKAAINNLQSQGKIADIYFAWGGNDVVTLPTHNALIGNTARWDATKTFSAWDGDDIVTGSSGADKIDGGRGKDTLIGKGGVDLLIGDYDDDVLDGGTGADDLQGGYGDDTYIVDNVNDVTTETAAAGIDLVKSSASAFTLNPYFENLTLMGTNPIIGIGNGIANVLTGNTANNTLRGMDGDDTLDGGGGEDRLEGGTGNDRYMVNSAGDVVVDGAGDTGDTVLASISYVLAESIEHLYLQGTGSINATGNASDNTMFGNSGNNLLNGLAGNDYMVGGMGNDGYFVDTFWDGVIEASDGGTDTVNSDIDYTLAAHLERLVLRGSLNLNGTGNELANEIFGNSGDNLLDGREGADSMTGGNGNDTYMVGSAGDKAIETLASGGVDTVKSSVSFTLGAWIENLTLLDTPGGINGTGNEINNVLIGNDEENVLNGKAGADVMEGGDKSDIYHVDDVKDQVIETSSPSGGTDTVFSSASFRLSDWVDILRLTGTSAINGFGSAQDNELYGNSAANLLHGGPGADKMVGGAGDDTYFVDSILDTVLETATGGEDTVQSWTSYSLRANLEHLVLLGFGNISGIGNSLDNVIFGNGGVNVIDGRQGADQMYGERGDDIYIVDHLGDRVFETSANGGNDLVKSQVTFTLGANVERLLLSGTAASNGHGNALDNMLTGNSGANILDGKIGADKMAGGAGDDTYFVNDRGDRVIESSSSGGTDLVRSTVTFTLGANLEQLRLIESASVNATGNALDNQINGNAGNNVLKGLDGADIIIGGAGIDFIYGGRGQDELRGGSGQDRFVFDAVASANADTILDFTSADDTVLLNRSVFSGISAQRFPAGAFVAANAAQDLDDRIIYDPASGSLYYDADGSGAGAQILFAMLAPGAVLGVTDFALYG